MNFPLNFFLQVKGVLFKDDEGYLPPEGGARDSVVPPGWVGRYQ